MTVVRGKGLAKRAQIEQGVDLSKQVVLGNVIFQAKLIKQGILIRWQVTHHRRRSLSTITAGDYLMWPYVPGVFQHDILFPAVPGRVPDRKQTTHCGYPQRPWALLRLWSVVCRAIARSVKNKRLLILFSLHISC
jgi:hypothetical protein